MMIVGLIGSHRCVAGCIKATRLGKAVETHFLAARWLLTFGAGRHAARIDRNRWAEARDPVVIGNTKFSLRTFARWEGDAISVSVSASVSISVSVSVSVSNTIAVSVSVSNTIAVAVSVSVSGLGAAARTHLVGRGACEAKRKYEQGKAAHRHG